MFCKLVKSSHLDDETALTVTGENRVKVSVSGPFDGIEYIFRNVFDSSTSSNKIFESVGFDMVSSLLQGTNCLLFTYDAPGVKPLSSLIGTPLNPGILPLTIDTLFETLKHKNILHQPNIYQSINFYNDQNIGRLTENAALQRKFLSQWKEGWNKRSYIADDINHRNRFSVYISLVEVENIHVTDVLETPNPKKKAIYNSETGYVSIDGFNEVNVSSSEDVFKLFSKGLFRSENICEKDSSCEHQRIFKIKVVQEPSLKDNIVGNNTRPRQHISTFSIVSLSSCNGQKPESRSISNVVNVARSCFECVHDNSLKSNHTEIPYEDSAVTYLCRNYFKGNSNIRFMITLSAGLEDFDVSLPLLSFGQIKPTSQNIFDFSSKYTLPPPIPDETVNLKNPSKNSHSKEDMVEEIFGWNGNSDKGEILMQALSNEALSKRLEANAQSIRGKIQESQKEVVLLKHENKQLIKDVDYRNQQTIELQKNIEQLKRDKELQDKNFDMLNKEIEELTLRIEQLNKENAKTEQSITRIRSNFQQYCDESILTTKNEIKKFIGLKISRIRDLQSRKADKIDRAIRTLELDIDLNHLNVPTVRSLVVNRK